VEGLENYLVPQAFQSANQITLQPAAMELIEVVGTQFVVPALVADQMEADHQNVVRHSDDGSLFSTACGDAVVLG